MRVEFEFDTQRIEKFGYTQEQVFNTVKSRFLERGLRCVSEGAVLAFEDNGLTEDFSNMWILIDRLINSGWFLRCASACRWYDEEDEEPEDVLSQAHLLLDKNT